MYVCICVCVCVCVNDMVDLGYNRSKVNTDHPTLTPHMQNSCALHGSEEHLHNIGKVLSHVLVHIFPFNVWTFCIPGPLQPI